MSEQKPKSLIEIIKEAGYVMVVRCKDCAYAIFKENVVSHRHIVCTKPFTERWQIVKPDDWFCAYGKRKELEGEA